LGKVSIENVTSDKMIKLCIEYANTLPAVLSVSFTTLLIKSLLINFIFP